MAIWGKLPPWDTTQNLYAKTQLISGPPAVWENCRRAWIKDDGLWKVVFGPSNWLDPDQILFPFNEGLLEWYGKSDGISRNGAGIGELVPGWGNMLILPPPPASYAYVEVEKPEEYSFADDFTMDAWCYAYADAHWGFMDFYIVTSSSFTWHFFDQVNTNQPGQIDFVSPGGSGTYYGSPINMGSQSMYHFAVTRASGTIRGFWQGLKLFEYFDDSDMPCTWMNIGHEFPNPFTGIFSSWGTRQLHFVKGTALWTADFTPPGYWAGA